MSVNNVTMSPALQATLSNQPSTPQAAAAPVQDINAPIKDEFVKKNSKKKILIGAAIAAAVITTAAIAFLGKKNASAVHAIKQIDLPINGKYDLSKESKAIKIFTNNRTNGFAERYADESGKIIKAVNPKTLSDAARTKQADVIKVFKGINQGIYRTADGVFYVNPNAPALFTKDPNYVGLNNFLANIVLKSDSSEFTPAQKNLIALMHQGKYASENSPLFKMVDADNLTRENIFDMIAKWAKDIDVDNVETIEFLNKAQNLKKGTCLIEGLDGFELVNI